MFENNSEEKDINKFYEDLNKELDMLGIYINLQKQRTISVTESHDIILMNTIKTHSKEWEELLNQTNDVLKTVLENISDLEVLRKQIDRILEVVIQIQNKKKNEEEYKGDLQQANTMLSQYLLNKDEIIEKVLSNYQSFEKFNKKVICAIKKAIYDKDNLNLGNSKEIFKTENIEHQVKDEKRIEQKQEEVIKNDNKSIEENNVYKKNVNEKNANNDNKILVISEKDNKVYLPYKIIDLKEELKNKKQYDTIEELIENEYIINLDRFKNSIRARFKESYNLIKKREKGSIISATQLALELMFNYSLNPAIIAACKNEDELDIYLDCLEDDELDEFKIFDIKYEMSPSINVIKERKSKH